jgi:hypothetical protein
MFWYPYTGAIVYAFDWSAGLITNGLALVALVGIIRVALFTLRSATPEAVSVPFHPVLVDDRDPEVKQAAA